MIMKLGMQYRRLEIFKVYIYDDPWDDLDIFYGKVKFGGPGFEWEKLLQSHLRRSATNDNLFKVFFLTSLFGIKIHNQI